MVKVEEGRRVTGRVFAIALLLGGALSPLQAQGSGHGFATAIDTLVREMPNEEMALRRLYTLAAQRPLWLSHGGPTPQTLAAITFIDSAARRGLRPEAYGIDTLHSLFAASAGPDSADGFDSLRLAAIDVALSRSLLQLLADLGHGQVDPASVGLELPSRPERDLASIVLAASQSDDVARVLETVEPPYAGYAALLRLLARYRALAADTTLTLSRDEPTVRPNDLYADAPRLRKLLAALGDLSPHAAYTEPNRYAGALVLAVMHFQRRHGLTSDGTIGPSTWAALRVPLATRVRQIELALERWRWLPPRAPARYVVVNIPAFRLYAFENDSAAAQPVLSMNVVVGEAGRQHDTPVFVSEMREVVFRPYWDVPPRIARTELVPAIKRGELDMESEGYEIVSAGDRPRVYRVTRANLDRVAAGTLHIRQRPGQGNALGLVKFVFPNEHDVYLHGTPAVKLFSFARRDFSHGCIRAEQPAALAGFVLTDDSTWNRAAIEAAMHGRETLHVPLAQPVTVFILYMTTVVAPDGTPYFYPDLYGEDAKVERVLGQLPNER
jgi:murein L,D-transpeptidase YcbB/YkuD